MREESEEARLMGNHTKTNSMSYTDGPRTPLAESAYPAAAAPPPYEKSMQKSPTGEEEKIVDQEILKDLMHYSGTTLMTQFHADAMKQVGFGKYQLLMIFITGLALAAQTVHMCSLFFVFPSLELEFCMTSDQKDMLVAINFVGAAFGAANMGAIAEINGRKRTLLTCMICMTLFSIVSAFMPTFGPFAMARFCAGACAGGVFPIAATYIGEMCPGHMRGRAMSMFVAIGLVGGTVAALVSVFVLPISGEELMLEQRRHFRAWHSYLLIMCLPAIVPIIGLLNLPESPRWLLDVGREVEALEIYQKSYCANRTNGRCTLTELELPGMRSERHSTPKSVLTIMTNNAYQFFESFTSLFRQPYKKVTIALLFAWFGAIFIANGLAVYVLRFGRSVEEVRFNAKTETTFNSTFENVSFTMNLVNKHFVGSNFFNCTFEQMLLSYVQFINCTFLDTNFHGVKTGNTTFTNSFLNNVKFIDTDLDEDDFINCSKNNTEFDRMIDGCDRQFDFNIFNRVGCNAIVGCITPTVLLLMISAETINHFGRVRTATFCITLATILCCMIGFLCLGDVIYWVVGVIQALIITGLVALTIFSTEYYCTYLRCTALGVFVAFSFIGALVGIRVYSGFPVGDTHIAAVMSIAGLSLPTMLTTFLRETSQLL